MVTPTIDNNIDGNVIPNVNDPGFRNSPQVSYDRQPRAGSETQTFLTRVFSQGRSLFAGATTGLKSQVSASLWLGVGVTAISFLAIGYLLGGKYSRPSLTDRDFDIDEIDAAAAEDLTIGRSY